MAKYFIYNFWIIGIILLTDIGFAYSSIIKATSVYAQEEPKTSGEILYDIRKLMKDEKVVDSPIQAYIVPSVDAHQSEYISRRDRRIAFVTGFTGSAGTAVIAENDAALWTDSRYHLQAEGQIDNQYWTLMKSGLLDVPTMKQWLVDTLPANSKVGIDPFLMNHDEFASLSQWLNRHGHSLVSIYTNLVDKVWTNRPELDLSPIVVLELQFSGRKSSEKLATLRSDISDGDAESFVITALDEVAWFLNLRGLDIDYNPVFFAYCIVSMDKVYLYLLDKSRITPDIQKHFLDEGIEVIVEDYDGISNGIMEVLNITNGKMMLSKPSQAIYLAVPEARRVTVADSPILPRKVVKNDVEAQGLRRAHIRDGTALIEYLHWLETNIDNETITELSGAKKLMELRSKQEHFRGLSFTAISAVGSHAAMPHYSPTIETDRQITRDEIYLIDSGGQYWDGTTDVTRTVHMGEPSDFEMEAFTRVLKGFIALNSAVFPPGTPFSFFDSLARKPLWEVGLNYGHGTGHGVGAYLNVHEFPPIIANTNSFFGMVENMFTSDEPGYYEDGEFGIRIEDVIHAVKTNVSRGDFDGAGALKFFDITLAPIQLKLIKMDLMTTAEVDWLNSYHKRVLETVGPRLQNKDTYEWLVKETRPISANQGTATIPKSHI